MNKHRAIQSALAVAAATAASGVWAVGFTLSDGAIRGNFDSTITAGVGVRTRAPGCDTYVGTDTLAFTPGGGTPSGTSPGCLDALSGYNDQGNLNYKKGEAFTQYLKGTHELFLRFPERIKFLARVNWVKDFAATDTSGYVSGYGGQSLTSDAKEELNFKARLLDLWVSKEFDINERLARLRVGNQVISWGESLFLPGGVNQTNAVDLMRLSQPGTQLKEAFLPAPIASLAAGLGHGVNVEAYVQHGWERNYFPPVGSYWSTSTIGKGADQFANGTPGVAMPTRDTPRNGGQYGVSVHYEPEDTQLNLGFYFINYHDKAPVAVIENGFPEFTYLEDRKVFGVSANFPLGNWAIGTELSYRPKDAVPLNSSANFFTCPDNKCYIEEEKYQFHLTGLLQLSPGDHGAILDFLGADSGLLLAEAAVVKYPNLPKNYVTGAGSWPIASGAWFWGALTANDSFFTPAPFAGSVPSEGTRTSWGYNVDFSWTYDGSLIPGWQVTPEIFFFHAVKGRTPNASALFMEGAKAANFVVTFTKNPASWVVGVNYAKFWGGENVFDQPLRDRDFVGAYVSRNF
ncbi:DUF1302 domain-containing protein [Denitromonas iodatirespirans]|uniref:DUF1302 domain-containing protein n=1 Tax=Denitromonas iodatirespirans TaxID=2795389 RepID=A0A944D7Y8_DENI1|nr:DUF1302 domain-containing protein [Denitromonas iodatirespirans]MBT0961619.1 DUF1302 domain-containing protein [Denitromonas iodatirespirans]